MNEEMIYRLMDCCDEERPILETIGENQAVALSKSRDEEVRIELARGLAHDAGNPMAERILCYLSRDKEELVRINAVDSMGSFPSKACAERLKQALQDKSALVRAYAALSLADIGSTLGAAEIRRILRQRLTTEADPIVLAAIYGNLLFLGEDCLRQLHDLFLHGDYHVQCWVLRALDEAVRPENRQAIRRFVDVVRGGEYPTPVSDRLADLTDRLNIL